MASQFREVLTFFDNLGVYDVILPFLLVFVIVFALLEKTKIFGTEEIEGKKYTRKNLNSMVAFVSAFFVVASSRLVAIINETVANVSLILIIIVCFLLLAGSLQTGEKEFFLKGAWATFFMILIFIAIALISLNAVKMESGESWLQYGWNYITQNWDTTAVSSIILVIIVIGFMFLIVGKDTSKKSEKKEE